MDDQSLKACTKCFEFKPMTAFQMIQRHLAPTVEQLQDSAITLLDTMIAPAVTA